jgi:hypothetical protein
LQLTLPLAGARQRVPQLPQLLGSLLKSTHILPHAALPPTHAKLHTPSKHTPAPPSGAVHVAPQPPQFFGSAAVSVHVPSQLTSLPVHSPELELPAAPASGPAPASAEPSI